MPEPVAIVGIGCRFPGGAADPDAFWRLIADGRDAVTEVPPDRWDADALWDPDPAAPGRIHSRWGAFLDDIDRWDAGFFGVSPREARRVDPQQRLLMEVAWEALEDAGIPPDRLAGTDAGVWVGISGHDYGDMLMGSGRRALIDSHTPRGAATCIAANRLSHHLDLRGPSVAVDTACSSSLTALHLACQSLAAGECGLAIVGGVNALLHPEVTMGFCRAGMLSPRGRSRPFDAGADGYVRGEGAGVVVLRPLAAARADGGRVRAVVRATGINQDGRTPGPTMPDAGAQEDLLRGTLRRAGVAAARVGYVEAHGTGTPVGDPVEATAIGRAVGAARDPGDPCAVGSAKGAIGHLEAAAGIAGLIRAALALERATVPGTLHHETPTPAVDWEDLNIRVPAAAEAWPARGGPPLAVVSSFGFGGANAAAVVEAAPGEPPAAPAEGDGRPRILPLSARSPEALTALADAWAGRLEAADAPTLRDVCHTAALRRAHLPHRLAVVADTPAAAARALRDGGATVARGEVPGAPPRVAFVFTGMGTQWWAMGRELADAEPIVSDALAECDALLTPVAGWSLLEELGRDEAASRIATPALAHAANLALQVALTRLWRDRGVAPDAVVGHSSGEAAAAWAAGALSLADALALTAHRGRLQARLAGAGGMLAVGAPRDAAAAAAGDPAGGVALAAVNGPASVTLSGDDEALARVRRRLERAGVRCVPLEVDVPYHGPQMAAIGAPLREALAGLRPRDPEVPMISTVTGAPAAERPLDAAYWWDNVRLPVRFADAVDRLLADGVTHFVEVGPHPVLAGAIHATAAAAGRSAATLPSLRRGEPEPGRVLRSLAALHVAGRAVDWRALRAGEGRLVAMPGNPWMRERHWLEPAPSAPTDPAGAHPVLGRRVRAARPTWELDLGDPALTWLGDHVVLGAPAFPATGYVEVAMAAAEVVTGRPLPALDRVDLQRLLPLDGRLLGCAVDEAAGVVEMHGGPPDGDDPWTPHARARIAAPGAVGRDAAALDLRAAERRCSVTVDPEALYRRLAAERGLRYGPAFRGVTSLRRGHGVALGRVARPPELGGARRPAHAALLDAALHVAAAGVEGLGSAAPDGAVVPVAIARAELSGPLPDAFWVWTEVTPGANRDLIAKVALHDDSGAPLGALEGVRLRALGEVAAAHGLEHHEAWTRVAQAPATARRPAAVARVAAAGARAARAARRDGFDDAAAALDAAARRHARRALGELGWAPGASAADLGVPPERAALMASVVAMAARAAESPPSHDPEGGYAPLAALVAETGAQLADTLRGRADARQWLFAEPGFATLAQVYAGPPFRAAAETLATMVAAAGAGVPGGLRVVEAGAGTGATSRAVLAAAGGTMRELLVTDVSPFLVRAARERLGDHPALRFAELDLEAPPPASEGGFDVAVAANAVHATRDLRESLRTLRALLAPGGLLLLQEALRSHDFMDLVFGQLDGWWRFVDHDLRPGHALAGGAAWRRALTDAGFEDPHVVATAAEGGEPVQAVIAARARAPRRARPGRSPRTWLILADSGGVADHLSHTLGAGRDRVTAVAPGTLRTERAREWAAVLRDLPPGDPAVLDVRALDAPSAEGLAGDALVRWADRLCGGVAALVRALRAADRTPAAIWLVTAGALAVAPGEDAAVAQAPLWGLGRVLRHEHGGVPCRLVDLPAGAPADAVAALARELRAPRAPEEELAVRAGRTLGRRLLAGPPPPDGAALPPACATVGPPGAVRLAVATPGRLESLGVRAAPARLPGPGEVAIRVEAAALNFKDLMIALGMIEPPGGPQLGMECVGIVSARGPGVVSPAPGERVVAVAFGTLRTTALARADLTAPAPDGLTVEEAATLPGAFASAILALRHLARLRAGERVLIHSAAGGVGLAAVQVAQRAGAEIVASASTEEKAAYLRRLGVREVVDSRSDAVADEVRRVTGGEGVDVVLNSLAGSAVRHGLALLRQGGRFVEMGRRDIDRDSPLGLAPFARGLSFIAMRMERLVVERPADVGALLRETVDGVRAGELDPLPHTVFELGDAEHAFRLMAGGRHIGRIVVVPGAAATRAPRRSTAARRADGDGTHLVVGGLGGLGLDLAGHLARGGARTLVLAGRRGAPRPEDAPALAALRATGARVVTARCDASRPADLARLLARIRSSLPPLRGVIQAAMVLDDAPLERLDRARVRAVLAAKAGAAWNLHELTRDDPLERFVMLGSVSGVVGPPSQGAYAAANALLVALAAHRRALGLPALTVDLGAVSGAGHVATRPDVGRFLDRIGIRSMPPSRAWAAMDAALERGDARAIVADVDWAVWRRGPAATLAEAVLAPLAAPAVPDDSDGADPRVALAAAPPAERPALAADHVAAIVARVLQAPPARLDRARPLTDLGIDSLMAVEVTTAVERELGVAVSLADVLEGLSIAGLAERVLASGAARVAG